MLITTRGDLTEPTCDAAAASIPANEIATHTRGFRRGRGWLRIRITICEFNRMAQDYYGRIAPLILQKLRLQDGTAAHVYQFKAHMLWMRIATEVWGRRGKIMGK